MSPWLSGRTPSRNRIPSRCPETGTFAKDDDLRIFAVTLFAPGTLTVRSTAYGGDVALPLAPCGFDTCLSLFTPGPTGLLLGANNDGPCGVFRADPGTGGCFDAILTANAAPKRKTLNSSVVGNV